MNNIKFNYDSLLSSIEHLEKNLDASINFFKGYEGFLQDSYRGKYIDILYEFYHSQLEFISDYPKTLDEYTEKRKEVLLRTFKNFVLSYARLLQFLQFAGVNVKEELLITYDYWAILRLSLIDYLEINK
ncbi:hypothetical protein ACQPVP_03410 [Clostridium nigeriense]|uniref:hypothetical protein n=1 Tax=Clostridium nigeriense TaxID=1805470 RepID=UPI003D338869